MRRPGWAGHQAYAVQDGGQLPDDRSVGPGWAAGRPGRAPRLLHWGLAAGWTDSLVVAAVKLVEVLQEVEGEGLLQVGLWANTLEQWRG